MNYIDGLAAFNENASDLDDAGRWDNPDLSILGTNRRAAPPFPVDVLGSFWSGWVSERARATSAPIDYVAASLLAVVGAALANVRWPTVAANGWSEPPLLWMGIIGASSEAKTPAMRPVLSLLRGAQDRLGADFDKTLRDYEERKQTAKVTREIWQRDVEEAVREGKAAPQMPCDAVDPSLPIRPRIEVNDATIEKLATLSAGLPRGLLLWRDELSGWLESFNRYSAGGDRAFALEMYQGSDRTVDRVKHPEPIRIKHLSIGVLGGIQPDKLAPLVEGVEDGLAPRFLWAWPDKFPTFQFGRDRLDETDAAVAFGRIVDLQMHLDHLGNLGPRLVFLSTSAEDVLEEFGQEMQRRGRDAEGQYANALGKARGHALRLSGIIQHLWWSASNDAEPLMISPGALCSAAQLMDGYFLPMAQRVYGDAALSAADRNAMRVARHLRKNGTKTFNARDTRREIGGELKKDAAAMTAACDVLREAGLIRPNFTRAGETEGRQAKNFDVNPAVHIVR